MLSHLLGPLLACLAFYWLLPRSENSLLVLLELKTPSLSQNEVEYLGNIRFTFKIQQNIDSHMGDADNSEKDKYNFALVTKHFPKEEESLRFGDSLKKIKNINNFQVLPFTTSNQAVFINAIIFLKRHLYILAPSLAQTFPSLDLTMTPLALVETEEEEEQGVFQEQCTEQKIAVEGPVVIINIIKIRDPEVLAKYNDPILFKLFPAVNTNILLAGKPRGDYWDQVALMEYANTASLCAMVQSEEWTAALPHKVGGLQDTQTYLARRLPVP